MDTDYWNGGFRALDEEMVHYDLNASAVAAPLNIF